MSKHKWRSLLLSALSAGAGWFIPRLLPLQQFSFVMLCLASALQTGLMFGLPGFLLLKAFAPEDALPGALLRPPASLTAGLAMLAAVAYTLVGSLIGALAHAMLTALGMEVALPPPIVPGSPMELMVATLTIAIITAACEELFFRMALPRVLGRWLKPLHASLLSSLLFALLHFSAVAFLPLLVFALLLHRVRQVTASYLTLVIFHAMYNFSILLINYAAAQPSLGMIGLSLAVFVVAVRRLLQEERNEITHSGL